MLNNGVHTSLETFPTAQTTCALLSWTPRIKAGHKPIFLRRELVSVEDNSLPEWGDTRLLCIRKQSCSSLVRV